MKDFSNNRAFDQHEYGHGIPGHDAGDGTKNNSQFKHEKEKGNQHKPKKEKKEMTRIIKNNITPALTVFAVTITILLTLAFNAKGADKTKFDNDPLFDNVTFAKTFSADDFKYDRLRYGKIDRVQDTKLIDFKNNTAVDDMKQARFVFVKDGFVINDRGDFINFAKVMGDYCKTAKLFNLDAKRDAGKEDKSDNIKFASGALDKVADGFDWDSFRQDKVKA